MPCLEGQHTIVERDAAKFERLDHNSLVGRMAVVNAAQDARRAGDMTATEFGELQQGLGFKPNPEGLLTDDELNACLDYGEMIRTDWMHDYLQQGVFSKEANAFLEAGQRVGVPLSSWRDFIRADWKFPHFRGSKASLHQIFSEFRESRGEGIKPKASEWIGLYSLMRHYAEVWLADIEHVTRERRSFEAACHVMDLILDMKRGIVNNWPEAAEALRLAQMRHAALHEEAYGTRLIVPKHHAALHVPEQVQADRCVWDMFIIERLNIRAKAVAEPIRNTGTFEESVLASLLTVQLNSLASGSGILAGLMGASKRLDLDADDALYARGVHEKGRVLWERDVVMSGVHVGVVLAGEQRHNNYSVIVQLLQEEGHRTRSSCRYRTSNVLDSFRVSDTVEAAAWYADGDSLVVLW